MKTLIILILFVSIAVTNQAQPNNFLRVFDPSGKKIAKGQLSGTTETSLLLKKGKKTVEIPFERIGHIIPKRSFGNIVLVSSLLTAGLFAPSALAMNSSSHTSSSLGLGFSDFDVVAVGLAAGAIIGATTGAIIGVTQKTEHFNVNGDREEWKKVKAILDMKILKTSTKNKRV